MINPYVGEVSAFGFKRGFEGWIKCEGQLISVQEFNQLFKVIGKQYGGDGLATFGLPNFTTITADGGPFYISAFGAPPTGGRNALPGETTIFTFGPPPPGWLDVRGQLLPIAQNLPLFKVLGTKFGGDGVNTFGVPDMWQVPPFNVPSNDFGESQYWIANVPPGSTDQGFMGEIKILPSTAPPNGWLPCDGRLLTINENTAMFSLLGPDYGGNGKTDFALPNITDLPVGLQGFICQLGVFPPPPPSP